MRKLLSILGLTVLLALSVSPAWAMWEDELYEFVPGEAGISGPVGREETDVHNYSASGAEIKDLIAGEAGITEPVEREAREEEVLLADCNEPFQGFMGEAGILEPVDRETC